LYFPSVGYVLLLAEGLALGLTWAQGCWPAVPVPAGREAAAASAHDGELEEREAREREPVKGARWVACASLKEGRASNSLCGP
jgi:hypothetical protein